MLELQNDPLPEDLNSYHTPTHAGGPGPSPRMIPGGTNEVGLEINCRISNEINCRISNEINCRISNEINCRISNEINLQNFEMNLLLLSHNGSLLNKIIIIF